MAYRIEIDRSALRSLKRLPNDARKRLVAAVDELASEPRPDGVTKLGGREEWRVRIGVYRVIYTIDDKRRTVTVWKVGHRKDVYRREAVTFALRRPRSSNLGTCLQGWARRMCRETARSIGPPR